MTHDHANAAVFATRAPAEFAVRRWFEVGFLVERLPIISKGEGVT